MLKSLLQEIKKLKPDIKFSSGDRFCWSPADNKVIYESNATGQESSWALLHEVAHASLNHKTYTNDMQLLLIEVEAWEEAVRIGQELNIDINSDYIQDCLDTYREWLHKRSSCPSCASNGLQCSNATYKCIGCGSSWKVSSSKFNRPYRQQYDRDIKTPPVNTSQTVFD
jgi:hypothetical protein